MYSLAEVRIDCLSQLQILQVPQRRKHIDCLNCGWFKIMTNINVKIKAMWLPLAYLKGILLISFFFSKKSVKIEFTNLLPNWQ